MKQINMKQVTTEEHVHMVAALAEKIWHQHFTPIIGKGQVEYMLQKFQSFQGIKKQLQDGYQYYFITYNGEIAGYSSILIENNSLFLSKLYIQKDYRGLGLSRAALEFYEVFCIKKQLDRIWLTCNKNNASTLKAYDHLGFQRIASQVSDIGSGYVMDDYILEKYIP